MHPERDSNVFSGGGIDRAGLRRKDEAWLQGLLTDGKCGFVLVWRDRHLVRIDRDALPIILEHSEVQALMQGFADDTPPTPLLGLRDERALFCLDISHLDEPESHPALKDRGEFVDIRDVAALMGRAEAQLMAHARGLLYWHKRHRFCGACGAPTAVKEAGHVRVCTNTDCGVHIFPRTDPAVIMLVLDGDKCLLGRRPARGNMMYSTLAGFVEPGESLEEAVAREVLEETGVTLKDVRYAHSQPWPFPANLMLGFYADAATTHIEINPDELADARWFGRDEVRELMAARDRADREKAGYHLPRPISIARRLIRDWLDGHAG